MAVVTLDEQAILTLVYWYTPADVASMTQAYADELILRALDPAAAQALAVTATAESVTYGTGISAILADPAGEISAAAEDIGEVVEDVLGSVGGAAGRGLAVSLTPLLPFIIIGGLIWFFVVKGR